MQRLPAAEASILKLHTKPVLSYQVPIFGTWPQNISAAEKIEFVLFRRIISLNPGGSESVKNLQVFMYGGYLFSSDDIKTILKTILKSLVTFVVADS